MTEERNTDSRPGLISRLSLDSAPRLVIGILMLVMVAINFANVVGRHAFGYALFWGDEIMTLLLVWGVFIGAVAVTYRGAHLRMDLVSARIGRPWSTVLNAITMLTLVAVACYIAYYSYQVASIIHMTGRVSDAARYPMIVQHLAPLTGLVLMVLAVLVSWRLYLFGQAED